MTVIAPGPRTRSATLPSGITTKMHQFAVGVVAGLSAADAYRAAFDTSRMRPKTVREEASRLLAHHGISPVLKELRAEKAMLEQRVRRSAEDRVWAELWELIEGEGIPPSAKLAAIGVAARIAGMFNAQKEPVQTASEIERELLLRLSSVQYDYFLPNA